MLDVNAAAKDTMTTISVQTNVKLCKIHSYSMFTYSNSDKETNLYDFHQFLSGKQQKYMFEFDEFSFQVK